MNLGTPEKFVKNHCKCYNYRNVLGKISLFLSEPNANTLLVAFYQDNKSKLIFFYDLFFRQNNLENVYSSAESSISLGINISCGLLLKKKFFYQKLTFKCVFN